MTEQRGKDTFATARQIADAVLFEGYVLYPYRASAAKNQLRWQFGVLVPPAYAESSGERPALQCEFLLDADDACTLEVEIRFLQVQSRTIEVAVGDGTYAVVDALDVGDAHHVPWDEGVDRSVRVQLPLPSPGLPAEVVPFALEAGTDLEPLLDGGVPVGRFVRHRWALAGTLTVATAEIDAPYQARRVRLVVENTSPETDLPSRDLALRTSLVAAHVLVAADAGRFVSSTEPPEWAKPYVEQCTNLGAWPVLVGGADPGRGEVLLCTPIILEDRPQIAPESEMPLYDGLEIDEILTLRTMTLTDEEKREARGTDPRAAAVIDRVDALPPDVLDRLHGAIRQLDVRPTIIAGLPTEAPEQPPWWNPEADASVSPDTDTIVIDGTTVGRGSKVVLQPGRHRRSDAQDLFLVGRVATVQAVVFDVDDVTHLAVTVDDDPGAEMALAHGRFRYFAPEEVDPL